MKMPDNKNKNKFVSGDTRGLQRMIVNLLENTVKYTSYGGVVSISLRDNKGHIVIVVQDTGIGISNGDLSQIFKQ